MDFYESKYQSSPKSHASKVGNWGFKVRNLESLSLVSSPSSKVSWIKCLRRFHAAQPPKNTHLAHKHFLEQKHHKKLFLNRRDNCCLFSVSLFPLSSVLCVIITTFSYWCPASPICLFFVLSFSNVPLAPYLSIWETVDTKTRHESSHREVQKRFEHLQRYCERRAVLTLREEWAHKLEFVNDYFHFRL